MSDKTNAYWWLPWAIVAVVMALSVLSSYYTNWYFLAPWTPARIVVTEMAISKFESGVASAVPHWDMRFVALGSIVMLFVVGPSLWVYGELKSDQQSNKSGLKKGFVWYLGAVLVVIGLEVVPVSFTKALAFQNTWGMADQHRENDRLRTELLKLGFDAVETYHRPRDQGGGGGSFQLTAAGNNLRKIQLTDLDGYPVSEAMSFEMQDSTNADSAITIYAISDKEGPDPNYSNADGRSGKIEIAITVTPSAVFDYRQMNAR